MKKIGAHLTKKQWRFLIVSGISFLIIMSLNLLKISLENKLYDQQVAQRWSENEKSAQISCFFSDSVEVNNDYVRTLEQKIDKALAEASLTKQSQDRAESSEKEKTDETTQNDTAKSSENSGRLWADTYSTTGVITIISDKAKIDVKAIGVEGDFFLFHPLKLLNGSYFAKDNLMKDGLVIDEDAAWQLFGSNDVSGMQVSIGGVPHYISGVIKRDSGRLNKATGLKETVVYLSLEHLEKYGTVGNGFTYEVVMPSPTSTFAMTTITTALGLKEYQVEIHENTDRFSLFSLISILRQFGTRSMRQTDIMYPHWENLARAYEDIFAVMLFCKVVFSCLILQYIVRGLVFAWKRRKWKSNDLKQKVLDLMEKLMEYLRNAKKKRSESKRKTEKGRNV